MAIEKKLARKLSRFLQEHAQEYSVVLAYLFGSHSQGRFGPLSDYDIAVLYAQEPSARERHVLAHHLSRAIGTGRLDLVGLNRTPIELKYSILVTGQLVYEASRAERVEFEAQTLSRYFDYLPILRRQRAELLQEQEEGYAARIQRYRATLRETERVLAQARTAQG